MAVTLTVLVDNVSHDLRLLAEHGFALWVEAHGTCLLFDTGQTGAVVDNALELGIDLRRTDVIALSHGHYDHTGGLARTLEAAPTALVYLHPEATRARYSTHPPRPARPVGMPEAAQRALDAQASRVRWVRAPTELCPGVGLTGPIPRARSFEDAGGLFTLDAAQEKVDDLVDDQALWIDTEEGVVVVTGCAHSGVVNTLDFVSQLRPDRTIVAVLGGFHLHSAGEDRLAATRGALARLEPRVVAPAHCTGERGAAMLRHSFPVAFRPVAVGTRLKI
jgi:7,8-dihydropterin-6-yl-methyl-4-(beta-D-ribofuranosyl)aminobenzene 5'-phosphate synthase